MSSHLHQRPARPLSVLVALAALSACDGRSDAGGAGAVDASLGPLTCASTADCQGTGVCVSGLCQSVSSCSTDSDCLGEAKVCHRQRFFCVQCDGRVGQCGEGRACQFDFTCVDVDSGSSDAGAADAGLCSGACGDRADCAPDRVCRAGACCPPPARCASPDDCPESAPQCNGATGQCFGGAGCFQDADCDGEPGCAAGACACEIRGAPPGTCRLRPDECQSDMDCWQGGAYANRYCALTARPRRCLEAPACTHDAECARLGLVCDLRAGSPSEGRCINGGPCSMGNECDPATQECVNGVCVGVSCLTRPSLCGPMQMCDPTTAMCVPVQSGGCTQNADCPQGQYCNRNRSPSRCEPGCRSNADCPGGLCNAMNQCEFPNAALCGACTTDAECPAGTQCVSIAGLSVCREPCLTSQSCSDPNRQCLLLYCSCLF